MCDDRRQEFILLSDVLGVSMLVDAINNRRPVGATESTVLGPFHVVESPPRRSATTSPTSARASRCLVRGRVLGLDGDRSPARVDVWQADAEGFYDVQKEDTPDPDLRGLFTTDADGRFWFRTVDAAPLPDPRRRTRRRAVAANGRHPYRPAHIHFIAGAEGHRPVTTHLFVEGSPYLDDDTVFGVKQSLVRVTVEDDGKVIDFDVTLGVSLRPGVRAPCGGIPRVGAATTRRSDARDRTPPRRLGIVVASGLVSGCGSEPEPLTEMQPDAPADLCATVPGHGQGRPPDLLQHRHDRRPDRRLLAPLRPRRQAGGARGGDLAPAR